MRYYLFQTIENIVKKNNQIIVEKINKSTDKINKDIKSTTDYVELSKSIQSIKSNELTELTERIN